jgi:ProP effector
MKKKITSISSTVVIKQKNQSRNARLHALNWMSQRFPQAFATENSIHALKIGILHELLQYADEAQKLGISKAKLREALVVFTRRLDYLACLKAQGPRINLFGEIAGEVSPEEANNAASKIKKMVEKNYKHQKRIKPRELDFESYQQRDSFSSYQEAKSPKSVEVVIKTKSSKTLDPNAINRLRSKLGLSSSST